MESQYLLLGRVQLLSGGGDGVLPLLPQSLHVSLQLPQLSCTQADTRGGGGKGEGVAASTDCDIAVHACTRVCALELIYFAGTESVWSTLPSALSCSSSHLRVALQIYRQILSIISIQKSSLKRQRKIKTFGLEGFVSFEPLIGKHLQAEGRVMLPCSSRHRCLPVLASSWASRSSRWRWWMTCSVSPGSSPARFSSAAHRGIVM